MLELALPGAQLSSGAGPPGHWGRRVMAVASPGGPGRPGAGRGRSSVKVRVRHGATAGGRRSCRPAPATDVQCAAGDCAALSTDSEARARPGPCTRRAAGGGSLRLEH